MSSCGGDFLFGEKVALLHKICIFLKMNSRLVLGFLLTFKEKTKTALLNKIEPYVCKIFLLGLFT